MFQFSAYLNILFDEKPIDCIERVAAIGYDGIEVYDLDRDMAAIARECERHGVDFVYMSGIFPPLTDPDRQQDAVDAITGTIERAGDVGCDNLNVKSGPTQDDLADEVQHESVVRVLQEVAPVAEAEGVTIVLEPLNTKIDHPENYLDTASQGFEVVEAVDSPNVRLLYDIYHTQVMEGDVIRRFQDNLDLIGHVHIADNPGRREPGTGELNYTNILQVIAEADYDGYVGCEFHPSGSPEKHLRDVLSLV